MLYGASGLPKAVDCLLAKRFEEFSAVGLVGSNEEVIELEVISTSQIEQGLLSFL